MTDVSMTATSAFLVGDDALMRWLEHLRRGRVAEEIFDHSQTQWKPEVLPNSVADRAAVNRWVDEMRFAS